MDFKYRVVLSLGFILACLINFSAVGNVKESHYACDNSIESLPIRQGGRVKPLYVHARESFRFLTGRPSPLEWGAVESYCRLSFSRLDVSEKRINLQATVKHRKIIPLLGPNDGEEKFSYVELVSKQDILQKERNKAQDGSGYQKAIDKVLSKIHLYQDIVSAHNWLIPDSSQGPTQWIPLVAFFNSEKLLEMRGVRNGTFPMPQVLAKAKEEYQKKHGSKHLLELRYSKMRLPACALVVTLFALAAMSLFKSFGIGLSLTAISLLIQLSLVTLRVIISERAPITNMYETVMFSGLGALLMSMIIGHFKRNLIFVNLGLAYNACTLMMLNFADGMLSDEINPLVPVLRDNFWLSTHVTTVIMAYGALALSWVLANSVLFKRRFVGLSAKKEREYAAIVYSCLKYGIILLSAGIILGGVWADYSWGRFWGWDPKETGSLIALCLYMAILHGRQTNWLTPHRFITLTAAAFLSIIMAWFGVNYILATGLHSYGFSEGGAWFVGIFTMSQIIFLIITIPAQSRSLAAPSAQA